MHVIGGTNGSGKSVVLSAIQAALGAKVKVTGRGDSITNLVKDGCHEARVKVNKWSAKGAKAACNISAAAGQCWHLEESREQQ